MSDWAWHLIAWGLTLGCFFLGVIGALIPALPGQIMVIVGVLIHWLILREQSQLGWLSLLGFPILFGLGYLAEWLAGSVGVKARGGSRWAMFWAFAGSLFGLVLGSLFIPLPLFGGLLGMLLGSFAGAYGAELYIHGKSPDLARHVGFGAVKGAIFGMFSGFFLSLLMIALFFVDRLF